MSKSEQAELSRDTGLNIESAEACDDGGVDVTLIRWMLSLTPGERVQVLRDSVRSMMRLRER
jgi:hypothetical protein